MTLVVRLRREAEQDLEDAARWYEEQLIGLGHQFLDETMRIFEASTKEPTMYPEIARGARRALLRRVPFGVYHRIEDSVGHSRRCHAWQPHPRHWKSRT